MLIWIILACGEQTTELPERVEDCPDVACRQAWVLHPDHADPLVQAAAIETIEQPEERIVLISLILDQNPHQPPELCALLPVGGDAHRFCERIQARPHLNQAPPPPSTTTRTASGPGDLALGEQVRGGFVAELLPDEVGCEGVADARSCLAESALRQARSHKLTDAARSCLALSAGQWRGECMFAAAEAALAAGVPYGHALPLCAAAEPFHTQCHSHLISYLASEAPSASAGAGPWEKFVRYSEQIKSGWADLDPKTSELAVAKFWSESVRLSYLEHPPVGDLLDHLPAEAAPHIRAAVTLRLLESTPSPPDTLEAWHTLAEEALLARAEQPHSAVPLGRRKTMSLFLRDHWATDRPGDESIPATYYLGTARRPTDPDPVIDQTLCLMEGIARQPWAPRVLFETARDSEVAVISWNASRLLAVLPRRPASAHRGDAPPERR